MKFEFLAIFRGNFPPKITSNTSNKSSRKSKQPTKIHFLNALFTLHTRQQVPKRKWKTPLSTKEIKKEKTSSQNDHHRRPTTATDAICHARTHETHWTRKIRSRVLSAKGKGKLWFSSGFRRLALSESDGARSTIIFLAAGCLSGPDLRLKIEVPVSHERYANDAKKSGWSLWPIPALFVFVNHNIVLSSSSAWSTMGTRMREDNPCGTEIRNEHNH